MTPTVACLSMLTMPLAPAEPWPAVFEVWDVDTAEQPVGRVWVEQQVTDGTRRCVEHWALATSKKRPASLQDRKLELKPTRDGRPVHLDAFLDHTRLRIAAGDLLLVDREVTAIVDGACDALGEAPSCSWGPPPAPPTPSFTGTWAPGTTRVRYGELVYGLMWKRAEGDGARETWVFDDPAGLQRAKMSYTWMQTGCCADDPGFLACACSELGENNVDGVARAYEVKESAPRLIEPAKGR